MSNQFVAKRLSVEVNNLAVDPILNKLLVEFEDERIDISPLRGAKAGTTKVSVVVQTEEERAWFLKCSGSLGLAVETAGSLAIKGVEKALQVAEPAAAVTLKTAAKIAVKGVNAGFRVGKETWNETKSGKDWVELKGHFGGVYSAVVSKLGGSNVTEEDI